MKSARWIPICLIVLSACGGGGGDEASSSPDPIAVQPPPPLPTVNIADKIDYLESFSKIATLVRYFHPSDGAANTDWDKFLVYGSFRVASVNGDAEYVATLRELFSSLAPTMRIDGSAPSNFDHSHNGLFRLYVQDGYVDEYETRPNIYQRLRWDVTGQELATSEFAPPEMIFQHHDRFVTIELPMLAVVQNNRTQPESTPFRNSERYELPTHIDNPFVCVASVSKIWGAIEHFFPYFAQRPVDWSAELRPLLVTCTDTDRLTMDKQIRLALTKLGDNHITIESLVGVKRFSWYTAPVSFAFVEDKPVVTYKTAASSPMQLGDELLAVDGRPIESWLEELMPISLTAPNQQREAAVSTYLLRCDNTERKALHLLNAEGIEYSVTLDCSENWWEARQKGWDNLAFANQPQHQVLSDNIHYVNLSKTDPAQVEETLNQLTSASAIILDLRTYPESSEAWQRVLSHFVSDAIPSGPMFLHYANWPERSHRLIKPIPQFIEPRLPTLTVPTVVLASRHSISQNEHALAYVQNAGLPILGEPTFGINGNFTRLRTFGGAQKGGISINFTGMEVRQNDGSPLIGVGIIPDILQAPTILSIQQGQDIQLQAAIDYLRAQLE